MKKKVISIVAAVLVGHVGVLYAISQMKAPELTPIDKQPLKVRFVKLQEAPKPLPPKPKAEPQKEPPKPKEVKIVDKPLPPPPKKVEKIEQVKKAEAPKVVKAPPVEAKPTPSPVVPTVVTETKVETGTCSGRATCACGTASTCCAAIPEKCIDWGRVLAAFTKSLTLCR